MKFVLTAKAKLWTEWFAVHPIAEQIVVESSKPDKFDIRWFGQQWHA